MIRFLISSIYRLISSGGFLISTEQIDSDLSNLGTYLSLTPKCTYLQHVQDDSVIQF